MISISHLEKASKILRMLDRNGFSLESFDIFLSPHPMLKNITGCLDDVEKVFN